MCEPLTMPEKEFAAVWEKGAIFKIENFLNQKLSETENKTYAI